MTGKSIKNGRPHLAPQSPKVPLCCYPATINSSPCFQVAELLGDHLAQVYAESVHDALRQVHVGRPREHFDVRHSGLQATHFEVASNQSFNTKWSVLILHMPTGFNPDYTDAGCQLSMAAGLRGGAIEYEQFK